MDRDRFIMLNVGEGLAEDEAERLWDEASVSPDEKVGVSDGAVREAARRMLPVFRRLRLMDTGQE